MNYKKIFLFCFLLLAINFVSASYELGNSTHFVSRVYGQNSFLIGELNISFNNQLINSLFIDSEGNEITLKDLLNTSSNQFYDYSCDVLDCSSSYESLEKKTSKTYSLSEGEEIVIGLKFKGDIEKINDIAYTVYSNAPAACSSQFKIDFLDDGVFDYSNVNSLDSSCDNQNTGCYNISLGGEETKISPTPFCQKIKIPETPKVELGVWLKQKTPGTSIIGLALYDLEGDQIDSCQIEKIDMTTSGSEVSCLIDYPIVESEEYYVCVYASNNDGDYRTKGYNSEEECGFYGSPVRNASANYYIFARGKQYAAPGSVIVSNQLGPRKYASLLAEEYILEKYGSMACESGCYVPIRIVSNVAQTITLKDFLISSDKANFPGTSSNEFHLLEEVPAKISSEMQWFSLNGIFNLPEDFGEFDYSLDLDGDKLFEEELEIKDFSITLTPTIAAAGFKTTFEVGFYSDLNATSYLWDFGVEGKIFETYTNKKIVTFEEEGNYTLMLIVDTGDAFFQKEFSIEIQSPKKTIEKVLFDLNYKKENLENNLLDLDYDVREKIKKDLDWESVSTQIELIKGKYAAAKLSGNYSSVIPYLVEINLPNSIIQSSSGKISYYPTRRNIDVEIVSQVFGDFYNEENYEKYLEAILFYNMEDYGMKVSTKDISYNWDGEIVPFAKTFYLSILEKTYSTGEPKLFIENTGYFEFYENVSKEGGYWIIPLDKAKSLSFFSESNMDIEDIPMFLAPSLSSLSILEDDLEPKKLSWWILVLILLVVLSAGFGTYLFLHKWYDKKYEKKLFPNKNNLFNLITYINNQKVKGIKESEIRDKLHKAKWSSEQIRFVLRKYLGKNTGMWKFDKKVKTVKSVGPRVVNQNPPRIENKQQNVKTMPVRGIKHRKIGLIILYSIITLGIYTIYWLISTSKELRKFDKRAPKSILILMPMILGVILTLVAGFFLSASALNSINMEDLINGGPIVLILLIGFLGIGVLSLIVYWKYSTAHETVTKFSKIGLFLLFLFVSPVGFIVSQVFLNKVSTPRQKT